jgi:UDP-3-O-[3-hydroxymyristoyl] glucosamine N-acyltransferase
MTSEIRASQIAGFLGVELHGPDLVLTGVSALGAKTPATLTFMKKAEEAFLASANAETSRLVIAPEECTGQLQAPHILVPRVRMAYAKVVGHFFLPKPVPMVSATARIHSTVVLGKDVSIGEFSVLGPRVVIGDRSVIRDHVVLRERVVVGRDCLIKSGTIVGEEGFGFEFEEDGTPFRIPHLGGVRLGDRVEVGALNVIARGTLEDTVLSDDVKTDDHVFIAHNVQIGDGSVVIAGAEVSGSVRIGRNAWISPQACIINQAVIGDGALVGMGAVVTKSVEAGTIVAGNPAKFLRQR